MKNRLPSILMSAALLALLPLGALAQNTFSVFSPQNGLADGWKTNSWSGPIVNEVSSFTKNGTMLQVDLKGDAKAYAGVILAANQGSGLPLTDKLRQTGMVTINFMPSKSALGGSQPLQVALSFLTKDGETVHAGFNAQAAVTTAETGSKASFTLPTALKGVKLPDQLASISAVRLQFAGEPVTGFYIIDCTIKSE